MAWKHLIKTFKHHYNPLFKSCFKSSKNETSLGSVGHRSLPHLQHAISTPSPPRWNRSAKPSSMYRALWRGARSSIHGGINTGKMDSQYGMTVLYMFITFFTHVWGLRRPHIMGYGLFLMDSVIQSPNTKDTCGTQHVATDVAWMSQNLEVSAVARA